jgi:hypothetical protein
VEWAEWVEWVICTKISIPLYSGKGLGNSGSLSQALFISVLLESSPQGISLNFSPKSLQLFKDFVVNNLKERQTRIFHLCI